MARACYYLSWVTAFGILAFCAWLTLSPPGFPAIPWFVAAILALVVVTLRTGMREYIPYWVSKDEPNQVSRVVGLILLAISLQLLIGAALQLSGLFDDFAATVLALGIWVGVPAIGLASGFVAWPRRQASPRVRDVAVIGSVTITLSAIFVLLTINSSQAAGAPQWSDSIFAEIIGLFTAATMEEVVFRVLLLTALVGVTGSRTQGLILSTVFFALCHAPLAFADPVLARDWDLLHEAVASYMPGLIWHLAIGVILGALWLRTGSLALIAVTHGLYNLGRQLIGV